MKWGHTTIVKLHTPNSSLASPRGGKPQHSGTCVAPAHAGRSMKNWSLAIALHVQKGRSAR